MYRVYAAQCFFDFWGLVWSLALAQHIGTGSTTYFDRTLQGHQPLRSLGSPSRQCLLSHAVLPRQVAVVLLRHHKPVTTHPELRYRETLVLGVTHSGFPLTSLQGGLYAVWGLGMHHSLASLTLFRDRAFALLGMHITTPARDNEQC